MQTHQKVSPPGNEWSTNAVIEHVGSPVVVRYHKSFFQ